MNSKPPKYALRFLEWYCPSSLHEGIEGDLIEQFDCDLEIVSERTARIKFVFNVIKFFRPSILFRNKFSNSFIHSYMLSNYFKIAFRSLWRSKAHSFINVFGLALGIACCVLIALFVRDEMTYDAFHSKANRIYRVYAKEDWGDKQQFFYTSTPFPMGPTLKENLAEVEGEVRINNVSSQVKVGQRQFNETVMVGGRDLFKVFDFTTINGN